MITVISESYKKTQGAGEKEAKHILRMRGKRSKAIIISLSGDLGSGKTTFIQGFAKGLGINSQINSPSFILIKKYQIAVRNKRLVINAFYHIDCYRLRKPWQLQELGFEEIINNPSNIVAIEWAERVEEILPEEAIKIKFEWVAEERRKIIIT